MTHFYYGYAKTAERNTSLKDIGNCTTVAMTSALRESAQSVVERILRSILASTFIHRLVRRRPCYHDATSPKVISTSVMLREARSPRRMRNAARKHLKEMRQLEFAIIRRHTADPHLQPADSTEFEWGVMRRYIGRA